MSHEGSDRIRELMNALRPALEKMEVNIEKILDETLMGYFPNLNKKEWIVCDGIASTVFDNDCAHDDAVIYYCLEVQPKKIFSDEADVKRTIKGMWEKGIIKYETSFISHKNFIRPLTRIYLAGNVEEEIVYCWRKQFEIAVKGTLSIHKTERQK